MTSDNLISRVAGLLKYLLGALFVFSALSKFVDIDLLNVYIFSFHILSLNASVVAGWMLISAELILGVALLSNRSHSLVCLLNMLLLLGFTGFLVFAQISGRTDSCHCFGELLPFNPVQSMLKNAVLIVLLLFVWKYARHERPTPWWCALIAVVLVFGIIMVSGFLGWRSMTFIDLQYTGTLAACTAVMAVAASLKWAEKVWVKVLICLTPVVAIFILAVAVNWIHHPDDNMVDREAFGSALEEGGALYDAGLSEGSYVVSFYSKTCSYCKMASAKLSAIQERNGLPHDRFLTIFPGTDTVGLGAFYSNGAARYSERLISKDDYVRITYGMFPLVLLVRDGEVVDAYSHGDLSERSIVEFLN